MEIAIDTVLADPASRTGDAGGSLHCDEFGDRVAQLVARWRDLQGGPVRPHMEAQIGPSVLSL